MYSGLTSSSILEEKKCNTYLNKSRLDFVSHMDGLKSMKSIEEEEEANKYISSNMNEESFI